MNEEQRITQSILESYNKRLCDLEERVTDMRIENAVMKSKMAFVATAISGTVAAVIEVAIHFLPGK